MDSAIDESVNRAKRAKTKDLSLAKENSSGESQLATRELPEAPTLPINPAIPKEGDMVLWVERSRMVS